MSSTRDRKRDGIDAYPTPDWLVRMLVPVLQETFPGGIRYALEAAAGDGAIIRVLNQELPGFVGSWGAVEIREECGPQLGSLDIARVDIADFLAWEPGGPVPDLIITNPPFIIGLEFLQHSLEVMGAHSRTILLEKQSFTSGQKRSEWMRDRVPDVFNSPRRPSFDPPIPERCEDGKRHKWAAGEGEGRKVCGKCGVLRPGNDSCDYAWMQWHKQPRRRGIIEILEVRDDG